jgi:hypothetical protein
MEVPETSLNKRTIPAIPAAGNAPSCKNAQKISTILSHYPSALILHDSPGLLLRSPSTLSLSFLPRSVFNRLGSYLSFDDMALYTLIRIPFSFLGDLECDLYCFDGLIFHRLRTESADNVTSSHCLLFLPPILSPRSCFLPFEIMPGFIPRRQAKTGQTHTLCPPC